MTVFRASRFVASVLAFVVALAAGTGWAWADISIVALGASNTAGKGVAVEQAYPAQVESMLRARGYSVRVTNAGVSGDTPRGMLGRLNSAVPAGTSIVILNPGGNDLRACNRRRGGGQCATREEHAAVIGQIRSQLRARGIKVVMATFGDMPDRFRQADGRHLTPEVHRMIAARLLPQIVAALGGRKR